jgi:hypothetical protein
VEEILHQLVLPLISGFKLLFLDKYNWNWITLDYGRLDKGIFLPKSATHLSQVHPHGHPSATLRLLQIAIDRR